MYTQQHLSEDTYLTQLDGALPAQMLTLLYGNVHALNTVQVVPFADDSR